MATSKEAELSEEISSLKRSIKSVQSELDEQVRLCAEASKTAEEMTAANMGRFFVNSSRAAFMKAVLYSELHKKVSSWEEEKNALIERHVLQ